MAKLGGDIAWNINPDIWNTTLRYFNLMPYQSGNAPQYTKPVPKTQREISISLQEPYQQRGRGYQPVGNPNSASTPNRGTQQSFKGDTTKPLTIGIQDIDESVLYYFENIIKPSVIQNGQKLPVPIVYGSPERWKSYQKDGYYRDVNGRIMAPMLMFKRESIDKVRTVANKLDANNPYNYGVMQKSYTQKNAYSHFNIHNNIRPEKQMYAVVVPDYVTVTYSCAVFTYYMDQLNKIVEAIEYASDSYWGDPARFKFKTMIDSFATNIEMTEGTERIAKSTFTIKLNGYIIPDTIQKSMNSVKKFSNKTILSFTSEAVSSINDIPNSNR
jgi:hypothetical protein